MTPQRPFSKQKPPCPICSEPGVDEYRPFCSKRCADIDLNRWLTGHYAVPVVELDEGDLEEIDRLEADENGTPGENGGER